MDDFQTDIPARLDRLPWVRFHWLLVTALGVTWLLDGLEATLVAVLAPTLLDKNTLHLAANEVGLSQSMYLAGAIGGAIVFGYLADRLGRKAPVHSDAAHLSGRCCTYRHQLEFLELCAVPSHDGCRHRRRVLRDQFGHRRVDSGTSAGTSRLRTARRITSDFGHNQPQTAGAV